MDILTNEGLQFRSAADPLVVPVLIFTNLQQGFISDVIEVHLWNALELTTKPTATQIKLTIRNVLGDINNPLYAGANNAQGQEVIDERWIEVKSNGIINPESKVILDDAMPDFVPIGGDPLANPLNFITLGDMPANTARKLFFRVNVPVGASSIGMVRFIPRGEWV